MCFWAPRWLVKNNPREILMRGIHRGIEEPLAVGVNSYCSSHLYEAAVSSHQLQPQLRHCEPSHQLQHQQQPTSSYEEEVIPVVGRVVGENEKTRSPTPPAVLATDGGGGFWLASVAAGAGVGAVLPPHGAHPAVMDVGVASAETGFISSQPSMAEFMTALPQGIPGPEAGQLQHSPGASGGGGVGAGGPLSPGTHHPGYHAMMDPHGVQDASGVNVPEYPWMKEKKTTRKSSQQGNVWAWCARRDSVVTYFWKQIYISNVYRAVLLDFLTTAYRCVLGILGLLGLQ